METPDTNQQFSNDHEWMNSPDETARRLIANPKLYERLYPESYKGAQEANQEMLLNDPMFYVAEIEKYLERLPTYIEEAQKGPDSAKIRKLEEIQRTITSTLRPSISVHPIVRECIIEHERELNDYLLIVLSLKQKLADEPFFEETQKWEASLGIDKIKELEDLTDRERALIHCYKQLPVIKRGEPLYNDYMAFVTPKKRLAHPNESKRKANSLVKSIEKILPFLTQNERQQAENEINTIEANFRN